MPIQPLMRRETTPDRGRHLVAASNIQKGQLIFCERPMIALQSTGNVHAGVLVCHYCMAFCGRPEQALEIASDPSCLPAISTTTKDKDPQQQQQEDGEYALIPCRNKCGHVYCSLECQQDDWEWGGHQELCTGCIEDSEHPLVKFKQHAMETNEIFLLIAQWLTRIHNHKVPYHEDDNSNTHALTDFMMNPWWDVATLPLKNSPMGFAEAIALDQSCRRLCQESHAFLEEAWPEHQSSEWLTPLGMARLIGSLEQNCMGIRRKHALRINVMEDVALRHAYHPQLIKCLERAGMIGDGEKEEEEGCCQEDEDEEAKGNDQKGGKQGSNTGDDGNNTADQENKDNNDNVTNLMLGPEEEWDYSYDEIAEFLSNLSSPLNIGIDDEWDGIFEPLDGTAHFSIATKMNHSCVPNVVLLYKTRGWGRDHPLVAYCVALKDIAPGEELTISYIISDDPYEQRQADLANYGFVCTCRKCQLEKDRAVSTEGGGEANIAEDNDEVEDDLFGDGDGDEEKENQEEDNNQDECELDGEAKLQNAVERLDTIMNKFVNVAIPLLFLAPVSNYTVQLSKSLLKDIESKDETNSGGVIEKLLPKCITAIQERDFCMCRIVGADLEFSLYNQLQIRGSWPDSVHRQAYWCAAITAAIGFANEGSFLVAIKLLDKAVILGQGRKPLEDFFSYVELHASQMAAAPCPPAIECKVPDFRDESLSKALFETGLSKPIAFPVEEMTCSPTEFATVVNSLKKPVVMRGFASEWPATTKWGEIDVLARRFGHRLTPIEVGSISTGMEEELVTFRSFVSRYLSPSAKKDSWSLQDATSDASSKIAYLAQHPLLDQIQALYDDVETNPCGLKPTNVNVWIGTGGTRTPLHFDSYDNLLVQLVGAKYVRLYGPGETPKLYVAKDKSYGLQGNMSGVDCEKEDFEAHPLAKNCCYTEVLLLPGDCLFIPSRHWHYVRSLSTSISINYWF